MEINDNFKPFIDLSVINNGIKLPRFAVSKEQINDCESKNGISNVEFLTHLCRRGFKSKIAQRINKEKYGAYADRIKYEIGIIDSLGFVDYILIIWDICYFCDKNKIPRGFGRGSVAGSLVSYLIDLTVIDPVEFELYFERFLSKTRAKSHVINGETYIEGDLAPDIDFECCYLSRHKVLEYINKKYDGNVCALLNINTLSSRILIKDILKTYEGANEEQSMEASSLFEERFGVPESIFDALESNDKFIAWASDHKETTEIALKLNGLCRSKSQHASAVLISAENINELIPLEFSKEKELISGIDMYSSVALVLKLDILGLKCLTSLYETCQLVGIDYRKIDYNHPKIYEFLQSFDFSYGAFQLESEVQSKFVKKIKPKNIWQLADCISISRPGASQFLEQYCDYVHHGIYKEINPLVDDALKRTGGICCYQEQLLKMLNNLGMSLDECEGLRKAIGKKLEDKIKEYKEKIYKVCEINGHPKKLADLIWSIAEDSAGYQFNASHAFSYAVLAASTVYMKIFHPKEFFLSSLKMARNENATQEIIRRIKSELAYFNINLLPPDLIKSQIDFSIEGNDIRFGLSAIKGISDKTLERLSLFKREYSSKTEIFDAARQSGLTIGHVSALIQSGCLNGFEKRRSRLALEAQTYNILTAKEKLLVKSHLTQGNGDILATLLLLKNKKNEKGNTIIKQSRFDTLISKYAPYKKMFLQNVKNERFANYFYENFYLGYSYSQNLRDIFSEKLDGLWNIKETQEESSASNIRIVARVESTRYGKTKAKGAKYFKIRLVDESSSQDFYCYDNVTDMFKTKSPFRAPKEDDFILIECNIKNGRVYVNDITIQDVKIYLNIAETAK